MAEFLRGHRKGQRILVAAATDSSALGVLDAARQAGREDDFAIVGQDCIPEVIEEMRTGKSAIIGSVSHEAESYGPRLIQLGIALLRGYTVPPYNYVRHRVVTPETLDGSSSDEPGAVQSKQHRLSAAPGPAEQRAQRLARTLFQRFRVFGLAVLFFKYEILFLLTGVCYCS